MKGKSIIVYILVLTAGFLSCAAKKRKLVHHTQMDFRQQSSIPVLCYHQLADSKTAARRNSAWVIPAPEFAKQMKWLHMKGYQTIPLDDFYRHIKGEYVTLPDKPILITFDDGTRDFLKYGAPVMEKYKFQAILFVIAGRVTSKRSLFFSWDGIRNAGKRHDIQSHTYKHPKIDSLRDKTQDAEYKKSRNAILKQTGKDPGALAFPFGTFNFSSRKLLIKNNYKMAFTVFPGANLPGDDPFFLRRHLVRRGHSLDFLEGKLNIQGLPQYGALPPNGSRIRKVRHINVRIPAGLNPDNLKVQMGFRFTGANRKVPFKYDARLGWVQLESAYARGRYNVVSISYKTEGREYKNHLLYLK